MARELGFFIFFLMFAHAVIAVHNAKRFPITEPEVRKKKALCAENIDNGLWGMHCKSSAIVKQNCVLRCISAACYDRIYGEDPLEEGEIDFKRGREFQYCVRRESVGDSITGQIHVDF
eukprot:c14205_g1_i1 orf=227-580(-)